MQRNVDDPSLRNGSDKYFHRNNVSNNVKNRRFDINDFTKTHTPNKRGPRIINNVGNDERKKLHYQETI